MKTKEIISYIFADNEDLSLEERFFLSSIIFGFLTSLFGSLINILVATSIIAGVIPLLLSTILGIIYYFVRFKKVIKLFIVPLIILSMLGISVVWIFNGGINGSNSITALVILILGLVVVPDKVKKYILALFVVLNIILYLIQFYRPDLITNFPTETERWLDTIITLTYVSFFIFLIMKFLHKNYKLERLRAEENEKRYRAFIETANEGILVAQGNNLKYVNPMISEITGFTEEELLSKPFIEFIHPDDRELMINNYKKRLKGEEIENRYHIRILTKHKGEVWVEMSGKVIDWEGQPATLNFVYDVTERKIMLNDLQESEARNRLIISNSIEAIYMYEPTTGKIIDANPAFLNLLGYTNEEVKELYLYDFIDIDKESIDRSTEIILLSGSLVIGERKWIKKDKTLIDVEITASKIFHKKNPILFISARNITERKLVEKDILEKNNQLQILINNLPAHIYFKNEKLEYQFVNQSYANLIKYEITDIIGKSDSELNLPVHFEKIDHELINKKKYKHYFESNEIDAEGNIFWLSTTKVLYSDDFGNIGIIGIVQDITERKKAENALLESELQFKSLFENAADAIFIADKNTGNILNANKAAGNLLQKQISEIIGMHQTQLHPPENVNFSKATFDKQKEELLKSDSAMVFENYLIRSDNTTVPVEILASEVNYKGVESIMGTFRNITERKQAEKEIHIKNTELAELNASKDKLFSIIAHDLKNPLGNFKDVTKLLAESYNKFSEIERLEFLNLMKTSSENVFSLLENLLEWSQSQRNKIQFNPIDLNLKYVSVGIINLLNPSAEKKQIKLINEISISNEVFADANMVNTILRNLISNAIKFTSNSGKIELGNTDQPSEGYSVIYVKDEGIGMSQEIIQKLFKIDQNITTLGTNNEKGTGLGLILCKEFVEKHGGRIWVDSQEGEGTTFYFTLPKTNKIKELSQ